MEIAQTALIASGLTIHGNITYTGELNIEGRVFGSLIPSVEDDGQGRNINVAEGALVQGKGLAAKNLNVGGKIECQTITITDLAKISKSAHIVNATIYFHTLEIEKGANLENCTLVHKPWPKCGRTGNVGGVIHI